MKGIPLHGSYQIRSVLNCDDKTGKIMDHWLLNWVPFHGSTCSSVQSRGANTLLAFSDTRHTQGEHPYTKAKHSYMYNK